MKRREFLQTTAVAGASVLSSGFLAATSTVMANKEKNMSLTQPKLPYALDALAPFLSEEQMRYHYEKHHATYFKNLAGLVEGKPEADMTLEKIIETSSGGLFNNAAQAWNHTFFWNCMAPNGGGKPSGELGKAINSTFGSYESFVEKFTDTAIKVFGSGWGWLAADKSGKLEILGLSNADTPIKSGKTAVLTVDVWEHAYYVDYRNDRAKFVKAFMDKVNWSFAEKCYAER